MILALVGAAIPIASGAQAVSWAHQNGSLQSNGAITVKSLSGGSYSGTVNPAGAVAKANQNAVTQPPTVIIQATSGGFSETIPMLISGASAPVCPAAYTRIWTLTQTGCPSATNTVYNAAGTRWSLVNVPSPSGPSYAYAGWVADGAPSFSYNSNPVMVVGPTAYCSNPSAQTWSASLCSK